MLTKRIIPCLDVDKGRVVKGKQFVNITDAGDPVKLAKEYEEQGADELVFLDITASNENRNTVVEMVQKVAKEIFIPFTVGGGIKSVSDMKKILDAGADKISINSSAINNPSLIIEGSKKFGSQCIVLAVDAKRQNQSWEVYINGGRKNTGLDVIEWIKKGEELGAGEILLTSMDSDGEKKGYDLDLYKKVTSAVNIPIIASGGAGEIKHMVDAFKESNVDAVLLASILHYKETTIQKIKKQLYEFNINVRLA